MDEGDELTCNQDGTLIRLQSLDVLVELLFSNSFTAQVGENLFVQFMQEFLGFFQQGNQFRSLLDVIFMHLTNDIPCLQN